VTLHASSFHKPLLASIRLLLLDSEPRSASVIASHLQVQGYAVITLATTHEALAHIGAARPHLALLAESLPGEEALAFCHELRELALAIPVLLLTSSDHYGDRIAALDAGADDVLSQPYALGELIARLRALLRRSRMGLHHIDGVELGYRDLLINTASREAFRDGEPIKLTVKEYDLLLLLFRYRGQVVPRQQLLLDVWGDSWVGDGNLLDVYIRYLRKKLERPGLAPIIHTVRGVGFMLK
jgi:two-component system, OmpR family, response regulator MprA